MTTGELRVDDIVTNRVKLGDWYIENAPNDKLSFSYNNTEQFKILKKDLTDVLNSRNISLRMLGPVVQIKTNIHIHSIKLYFHNKFTHNPMRNTNLLIKKWYFFMNDDSNVIFMYTTDESDKSIKPLDTWQTLYVLNDDNILQKADNVTTTGAVSSLHNIIITN